MNRRLSWGTGIALVYGLFALSTSAFVAFAMGRRVDLVSADYYDQSLQVDARMAAARNGLALGEALRLEMRGDTLTVQYPVADGSGAIGRIRFYRTSDARADREIPMALDGAGRQRVPLGGLAPGAWKVQLEWRLHGRQYFVERALTLP